MDEQEWTELDSLRLKTYLRETDEKLVNVLPKILAGHLREIPDAPSEPRILGRLETISLTAAAIKHLTTEDSYYKESK